MFSPLPDILHRAEPTRQGRDDVAGHSDALRVSGSTHFEGSRPTWTELSVDGLGIRNSDGLRALVETPWDGRLVMRLICLATSWTTSAGQIDVYRAEAEATDVNITPAAFP